jgi:hypothetical protein
MNIADDVARWQLSGATWICAGAVLLSLLALVRVPGWWRGSYNSGQSLGRQRTYLVQWVGITFIMLGVLFASLLPDGDQFAVWQVWVGRIPVIIGALFILLIPLVWNFAAFEFLVPPGLRRNVPGGPPDFGSGHPLTAALEAQQNAPPRTPVGTPAATGPAGSGTMRFERPRAGWRDRAGAYRVELDDLEVGTLPHDTAFTLPVAAGTHVVRGAISFTGSPKVEVQVRPGETTVVRIRPVAGNPLVQVAAPDTFLTIEVAED